jgi:hypothetical protein
MTKAEKKYDFFLSYCHHDVSLVRTLDEALQQENRTVWYDRELKPGAQRSWRDAIAGAIDDSWAVVVLLTAESAGRPEVKREMQYAEQFAHVPLIPVVVGGHARVFASPEARGTALQISTLQHIPIPDQSSTDVVVRHCLDCLKRLKANEPVAEAVKPVAGPALEVSFLEALAITDEDLPGVTRSQNEVVNACGHYFNDCARQGDWRTARNLLRHMALGGVGIKELGGLRGWLDWVERYELARSRTHSWAELVRQLEELDKEKPASPAVFRTTCPPVAVRLGSQWWQAVDHSFEQLLNCLDFGPREGSMNYAIESLDLLQGDVLTGLARYVDGMEALTAQGSSLREAAVQALATFGAPLSAGGLPEEADLIHLLFPPVPAQLRRIREQREQEGRRTGALARFIAAVRSAQRPIAAHCGDQQSATRELIGRLEELRLVHGGSGAETDLGRLLRLLEAWAEALNAWSGGDPQGPALAHLLQTLEGIGSRFPAAARQAACLNEWAKRSERYQAFRQSLASGQWPDSAAAAGDCASASERLRDEIARPWLAHLESQSGAADVADRVRGWLERLERTAQELRLEQALFAALDLLRQGNLAQARTRLPAAPAGAEMQPWIDLVQSIQDCLALLGDNAGLLRDGCSDAAGAFLDATEAQFASWVSAVEAVRGRLARARESSTLFARFEVPWLDRLQTELRTLAACRPLWARSREALERGQIDEALGPLRELARCLPAAGLAVVIVEGWSEAERRCRAATLMKQRKWQEAAQALADLLALYEQCEDKPAGFAQQALACYHGLRLCKARDDHAYCGLAQEDERRLEDAFERLAGGDYEGALGLFEAMQADLPHVERSHGAAMAIADLNTLLRQQPWLD